MVETAGKWYAPVVAQWRALAPGATLAVAFPAYRPDLATLLAARLATRYCDFRQTRMQPLGWTAARLPLDALDAAIAEEMAAGGDLLFQNSEALLSVHAPAARRAWLTQAFRKRWPARLALPVVLYVDDLDAAGTPAVVRLPAGSLPAETLLDRLNGLR